MKRIQWLSGLALAVALLASGGSFADPEWEYIGLAGTEISGITSTDGGLCAMTAEGFQLFDSTAGAWTAYTEPGVTGRGVTCIGWFTDDSRVLNGRLDADGHGYLEFTGLAGQANDIVYQGTAGAVVDVVLGHGAPDWAASAAGAQPGELLRSDDNGATWQLVTGHGMTGFSDLAYSVDTDELYAAGDAGVVRTGDGGASWESISTGLPAEPVNRLFWMYTNIPELDGKTQPLPNLYATMAQGLYVYEAAAAQWEQVLAESCIDVAGWAWSYARADIQVITADYRLLNVHISVNSTSWNWRDCTSTLTGLVLVNQQLSSMTYIATASNGVYRADFATDVPEVVGDLNLKVAPNPFNPAAEIRFDAPVSGLGSLRVYDLSGRLVADLLNEPIAAGPQSISWRPTDVPSGTYLFRLKAGDQVATSRAMLVK